MSAAREVAFVGGPLAGHVRAVPDGLRTVKVEGERGPRLRDRAPRIGVYEVIGGCALWTGWHGHHSAPVKLTVRQIVPGRPARVHPDHVGLAVFGAVHHLTEVGVDGHRAVPGTVHVDIDLDNTPDPTWTIRATGYAITAPEDPS